MALPDEGTRFLTGYSKTVNTSKLYPTPSLSIINSKPNSSKPISNNVTSSTVSEPTLRLETVIPFCITSAQKDSLYSHLPHQDPQTTSLFVRLPHSSELGRLIIQEELILLNSLEASRASSVKLQLLEVWRPYVFAKPCLLSCLEEAPDLQRSVSKRKRSSSPPSDAPPAKRCHIAGARKKHRRGKRGGRSIQPPSSSTPLLHWLN